MFKEVQISKSLLEHEYKTMKVKDIMDKYQICCQSLYNILDEIGVDRKKRYSKPRAANKKIILKD